MQIMHKFMRDLKSIVEQFIEKQEFEKAIELLSGEIKLNPDQIELFELRGEVYYTQQKFGDALNDFNKVLKVDKENKLISSKAQMAKEILRFQNLDIYESTNLNHDPWLD